MGFEGGVGEGNASAFLGRLNVKASVFSISGADIVDEDCRRIGEANVNSCSSVFSAAGTETAGVEVTMLKPWLGMDAAAAEDDDASFAGNKNLPKLNEGRDLLLPRGSGISGRFGTSITSSSSSL